MNNLLEEFSSLERFVKPYYPAIEFSGILYKPAQLHFTDKLTEGCLGQDVLFIELEFAGKRTRILNPDPIALLKEARAWFEQQIAEIEELAK